MRVECVHSFFVLQESPVEFSEICFRSKNLEEIHLTEVYDN